MPQFADATGLEDAAGRIETSVRGYRQFLKSNPMVRDILCAALGDNNL